MPPHNPTFLGVFGHVAEPFGTDADGQPTIRFPETLSSRLARVEEARRAAVERRETDVEAFSATDTLYVDLLETTLAEIEDKLTGINF